MNSSGDWLRRGKGLLAIVAASACIGAGAFASPSSAYAADATTWESLSTDLKNSSYGFFKWKAEYGKTQLERKVAADAAGILVNSSLPKTKATGKATSATSLNNFLQSVQSLVSINSWRQTLRNEPCRVDLSEGRGRACDDGTKTLTPYLTNDTLMAVSQVNADNVATSGTTVGNNQKIASTYYKSGPESVYRDSSVLDSVSVPVGVETWYAQKAVYSINPNTSLGTVTDYEMLTNKLGTSYVEYKYAGYSSSSVAQGVTAQVLDCQSDAGASAYAGYSQKAEDYLSDVRAYVKTVASATSDVPTVPTIVSVADPAPVTTTSGTRPVLPVTVEATKSDGTKSQVPVVWNSVPSSSYSTFEASSFKVTGKVSGWSKPVTVTVNVLAAQPKTVTPVVVTTESGKKPSLPSSVQVLYSNKQVKSEAVAWDAVDASKYSSRAGGQFTVSGHLVSSPDTHVTALVVVSPATIISVTNPSVMTVVGVAPSLPATVNAKWSNGDVTDEKVTWDSVQASSYAKAGTFTVSGKVTGYQPSVKATVRVCEKQNMYRLYNKYTGEHFYTASVKERDTLRNLGWKYERVGWVAPSESNTPVYRLYNKYVAGGDHHYTTSASERDALVKLGWIYEGIGWYSAENAGSRALYREYNPYAKTGTHNYTLDKHEHDTLVSLGWHDEGTAWYSVS
ncbi:Ig-like domain-containing protein [Bifidobacterium thermophilum]|uniref:Ig-like domain-containing protein n=1 Tax=Bifidobacterium thermophilum TaxID=33905 RepID=UPI0039923350